LELRLPDKEARPAQTWILLSMSVRSAANQESPLAHVTDTYWYVSGTPELMEAVGERLEKRWEARR
jgi:hypothetical protein